jgi:hypothetical protein
MYPYGYIIYFMRRKQGALVSFEISIINAAVNLRQKGFGEFYGFQVAKEIQEQEGAHFLHGYSNFYRALDRLEKMEFLESRWEDPVIAANENRPRRCFYCLTGKEAAILSDLPVSVTPKILNWGVVNL